jgi:hypothetical protein
MVYPVLLQFGQNADFIHHLESCGHGPLAEQAIAWLAARTSRRLTGPDEPAPRILDQG